MATEHEVRAQLTLETKNAAAKTAALEQRITGLSQRLQGAQSSAGGLVRQLLAVGAGYVGLQAGISAVKALTVGTIGYTAALQKTKIGLATVMSSVEGMSFAAAQAASDAAFGKIVKLAAASPAGPAEMFEIFQGILAPMRAAGQLMDDIYTATNNTVLAASALNVDLKQAQMDIVRMAQGQAGMDVKLFMALKSAKAITEETEEWNKMAAPERAQKLAAALKKFEASGEAFGKSFSGQLSTLIGNLQESGRWFITPLTEAMANRMGELNAIFDQKGGQIEATLTGWGFAFADGLDRAVDKTKSAVSFIITNWDQVTQRMEQAAAAIKEYAPAIKAAGVGYFAADVARAPLGMALSAAAPLPGKTKELGGQAAGAFRTAALAEMTKQARGRRSKRRLAGSLEGEDIGFGDTNFGALDAVGAALAATSVNFVGLKAALAALGPVVWPIVGALAAVAAVGVAIYANFDLLSQVFGNLLTSVEPLGERIMMLASDFWDGLRPILETVGLVLTTVVIVAFKALAWTFSNVIMPVLEPVVSLFRLIGETIDVYVLPSLRSFIGWLGDVSKEAEKDDYSAKTKGYQVSVGQYSSATAEVSRPSGKTPSTRSKTTINVDKMIIKQEFKGNKDPDRVIAMMLHDITKQSERRVSARYVGALTR